MHADPVNTSLCALCLQTPRQVSVPPSPALPGSTLASAARDINVGNARESVGEPDIVVRLARDLIGPPASTPAPASAYEKPYYEHQQPVGQVAIVPQPSNATSQRSTTVSAFSSQDSDHTAKLGQHCLPSPIKFDLPSPTPPGPHTSTASKVWVSQNVNVEGQEHGEAMSPALSLAWDTEPASRGGSMRIASPVPGATGFFSRAPVHGTSFVSQGGGLPLPSTHTPKTRFASQGGAAWTSHKAVNDAAIQAAGNCAEPEATLLPPSLMPKPEPNQESGSSNGCQETSASSPSASATAESKQEPGEPEQPVSAAEDEAAAEALKVKGEASSGPTAGASVEISREAGDISTSSDLARFKDEILQVGCVVRWSRLSLQVVGLLFCDCEMHH